MDRQEEYQRDGNNTVGNQNHRYMIQDHAKQARGKGNDNGEKKQPALYAQFPAVDKGMYQAQQQEKDGCHLMNLDPREGNCNGHDKTNQQRNIQNLFHLNSLRM